MANTSSNWSTAILFTTNIVTKVTILYFAHHYTVRIISTSNIIIFLLNPLEKIKRQCGYCWSSHRHAIPGKLGHCWHGSNS